MKPQFWHGLCFSLSAGTHEQPAKWRKMKMKLFKTNFNHNQIYVVLTLCLCIFLGNPLSVQANAADTSDWKRHSSNISLGYDINRFFVAGEDNFQSIDGFSFGHGGHIAYDWQGKSLVGFMIPFSYNYNPDGHFHEYDIGGNLMVHFTKRDKAFDPYFGVGIKLMGAGSGDVTFPPIFPFLNARLGLRYFVTPRIGLFAEAGVSTAFVISEFEGRVGVSIGF